MALFFHSIASLVMAECACASLIWSDLIHRKNKKNMMEQITYILHISLMFLKKSSIYAVNKINQLEVRTSYPGQSWGVARRSRKHWIRADLIARRRSVGRDQSASSCSKGSSKKRRRWDESTQHTTHLPWPLWPLVSPSVKAAKVTDAHGGAYLVSVIVFAFAAPKKVSWLIDLCPGRFSTLHPMIGGQFL